MTRCSRSHRLCRNYCAQLSTAATGGGWDIHAVEQPNARTTDALLQRLAVQSMPNVAPARRRHRWRHQWGHGGSSTNRPAPRHPGDEFNTISMRFVWPARPPGRDGLRCRPHATGLAGEPSDTSLPPGSQPSFDLGRVHAPVFFSVAGRNLFVEMFLLPRRLFLQHMPSACYRSLIRLESCAWARACVCHPWRVN